MRRDPHQHRECPVRQVAARCGERGQRRGRRLRVDAELVEDGQQGGRVLAELQQGQQEGASRPGALREIMQACSAAHSASFRASGSSAARAAWINS